jgi:predicted metal-dependent hydrolase
MSDADIDKYAAELIDKLQRKRRVGETDVRGRADALADRYGLPRASSTRFVDNQSRRWGSCTPAAREIRLSARLAEFPAWVLDYVIVHELAHFIELNHTPRFYELVDRYPKADLARGFLIGVGFRMSSDPADDASNDAVDNVDDDVIVDLRD